MEGVQGLLRAGRSLTCGTLSILPGFPVVPTVRDFCSQDIDVDR